MTRFSLKTLLMLVTIVALSVALVISRIELYEKASQLKVYRDEMRHLDISDSTKINAISIPGYGRKSWRWRVHLPTDRRFRLGLAFNDIPMNGLPGSAPDSLMCELPPGESILSASLNKESGKWGLNLYSETEGNQNFDFVADVDGANVDWLDQRGGNSVHVAGNSTTEMESPSEPFVLLSLRRGLSPSSGVTGTNPNPTDGVLIWLQEIEPTQ